MLNPSQHAHERVLSLTVQTGNADDFALSKFEIKRFSIRPQNQIFGAHRDLVALGLGRDQILMERVCLFARHRRQKIALGDLFVGQNADIAPVTQHRGPVRDAHKFRDAVGDDQDRGARIAQIAHFLKEAFGAVEIKRRRAFIKDQQARIAQHAAGDGNPLFQAKRQIARKAKGVHLLPRQITHQLGGALHLLVIGDRFAEKRIGPHEHVVDDCALIRYKNFLIDGRYSDGAAFGRGVRCLSQNGNRAAVDWQYP